MAAVTEKLTLTTDDIVEISGYTLAVIQPLSRYICWSTTNSKDTFFTRTSESPLIVGADFADKLYIWNNTGSTITVTVAKSA